MDHRVTGPIDLVHDQQARPIRPSQAARDRRVQVGGAGAAIDHEDHRLSVLDRDLGLPAHPRVAARRGGRHEAAGVDDQERSPAPLGHGGVTVARDSGPVVHDRPALAQHAIEEGRFADVRATDDGDDRQAHGGAHDENERRAGGMLDLAPARRTVGEMERATGFEPATSSLGSSRSTN